MIQISKPTPPYVYIAGAGPGDPSLLTLKVVQLMQEVADIVVYDRLIPQEILDFIPGNVKKIYAGKSCRKHVMTQDEINLCLSEEASKGQVVLRLKGGDPFIFGRGGEEAIHLLEHNIPFEIVPGVSAAVGCAAYEGIPLTHRGVATSVRFITGHQQKGAPIEIDWKSLADQNTTIVIYMGLANINNIVENLLAEGLSKDTPAAAIQDGTINSQKSLFTTLDNLVFDLENSDFKSPTMIYIGKVVGLNLFGKK